ncbi:unnamed protein product [Ilex paraguariensis]
MGHRHLGGIYLCVGVENNTDFCQDLLLKKVLDLAIMATSLEELLAEEGFRGRRSKTMARASAVSMPLYPFRDEHKAGSPSGVKRTERTRSDIHWYDLPPKLQTSDTLNARRPRDNLSRREKSDRGSKNGMREKLERKSSSIDSLEDFSGSNIIESAQSNEIVEVAVKEYGRYKDIYSNEVYSYERSEDTYISANEERGRHRAVPGKDMQVEKRHGTNSKKNLPERTSFNGNQDKSMNQRETAYTTSKRSSKNNKSFGESKSRRQVDIEKTLAEPALHEVAVQAIISILCGYVKCFLKDEDFRTSLHHNSSASLDFSGLEEGLNTESKVIANLEQAIETVERAAEERTSAKELKKASLQLSVITGLNSNELKYGFTHGIPNFKLSACAHLYLSVIYKLQKKDRIAAKHLLQVFCDSPFQARTTLLPELWDYLFLPHLSHLKAWYDEEADSLADTLSKSKTRKLQLLEKVYNEILDTSTYQFSVYYKDWLTEGIEAPSLPSIQIPSISFQGSQQGGLHDHASEMGSPAGPFSPQPMVSKKLYDAVFGRSCKPGVEVEDYKAENFDNSGRSTDDPAVEDKQTLTFSTETVKHTEQDIEHDSAFPVDNEIIAEQARRLDGSSESTHMSHVLRDEKENELALKKIAKSVFEIKQTEEFDDLIDPTLLPHPEDVAYPHGLPTIMRPSMGELHANFNHFDGPVLPIILKDFICPLTGLPFEDPVTLETGQTFEQAAITEWFDKGNRTCPVTGIMLECLSIPLTNFILKRVMDSWKSESYRNLLAFASRVPGSSGEHMKFKEEADVFRLEQLLISLSTEERIKNAKQLISLGGLEFLTGKIRSGNLEEKTCVTALLVFCIEADAGCRNHVAKNIDKPCLLDLLHSKQATSRRNAVFLLIELICLNR